MSAAGKSSSSGRTIWMTWIAGSSSPDGFPCVTISVIPQLGLQYRLTHDQWQRLSHPDESAVQLDARGVEVRRSWRQKSKVEAVLTSKPGAQLNLF